MPPKPSSALQLIRRHLFTESDLAARSGETSRLHTCAHREVTVLRAHPNLPSVVDWRIPKRSLCTGDWEVSLALITAYWRAGEPAPSVLYESIITAASTAEDHPRVVAAYDMSVECGDARLSMKTHMVVLDAVARRGDLAHMVVVVERILDIEAYPSGPQLRAMAEALLRACTFHGRLGDADSAAASAALRRLHASLQRSVQGSSNRACRDTLYRVAEACGDKAEMHALKNPQRV